MRLVRSFIILNSIFAFIMRSRLLRVVTYVVSEHIFLKILIDLLNFGCFDVNFSIALAHIVFAFLLAFVV